MKKIIVTDTLSLVLDEETDEYEIIFEESYGLRLTKEEAVALANAIKEATNE